MRANIKYFIYLIRHKYYVGIQCFKHGLYWRGIKHDWTKFLPCEWIPYAQSFYGKYKYNERPDELVEQFDRAWLHHQHANSHHWQHWVLREDSGVTKILKMPRNDALEMYCDWVGAGQAITGKKDVKEWYEKNKEKIMLHPDTRWFVEWLIYIDY